MKQIKEYITEKFKLNSKNITKQYNYYPKDKDELKELIDKLIKERGTDADLNDIDVSKVKDMSFMFYDSKFNGDISKWNVSNVKYMDYIFTYSKFNGDISNWDVSNVENIKGIFSYCPLEKNPPKWYKA